MQVKDGGMLRFSTATTQGLAANLIKWHRGHSRYIRDPEVLPFVKPLLDLGFANLAQLLQHLKGPTGGEVPLPSFLGAEAVGGNGELRRAPSDAARPRIGNGRGPSSAPAMAADNSGQGWQIPAPVRGHRLPPAAAPHWAAVGATYGRQLEPSAAAAGHGGRDAYGVQPWPQAAAALGPLPLGPEVARHSSGDAPGLVPDTWSGTSSMAPAARPADRSRPAVGGDPRHHPGDYEGYMIAPEAVAVTFAPRPEAAHYPVIIRLSI